MNKILPIILVIFLSLNSQALFEIKDASDNTVLEVAADGLRIFNMGDTLMVISSTEIKAFIDDSAKDRALSRSFSITTSTASGKGMNDVVNIAGDGLRVYSANENLMDITTGNITAYIDTSYSFNVTSSSGGKLNTDVLEVGASTTQMREGGLGERYTDFSPENIFLGLNAGINTTNIDNIFLGNYSGYSNVTGYKNCFMGNEAGFTNYSGRDNVFIGNSAGYRNYDGDFNVFIGYTAGSQNTSGSNNVFIGNEAGIGNLTGSSNTYVGEEAGVANSDGYGNSCFGSTAGFSNNHGDYNTNMGHESNSANETGSYNSSYGALSGKWNFSSGSSNSLFGYQAGYGVATPTTNTYNNNSYFGTQSGFSTATGSNNSYFGYQSGYSNNGSGNVFIGYQAGYQETGSELLYIDNSNTTQPLIYGDFDGDWVKINGDFSVLSNSDLTSVIVDQSLRVDGTSDLNGGLDVIGNTVLNGTLTTTGNTSVGGILTSTGNANLNGSQTWVNHNTGTTNGLFIKNKSADFPWHFYEYSTGDLKLYYNAILRGTWNQTTGVYTSSSDKRFKKNIQDFSSVMDKVMQLEPKNYNFITQSENDLKYMGFIAQDVEKLFPSLAQYNDEDDVYTLDYSGFSVVAIQAIKELKDENDKLNRRLNEIEELLKSLK